MKTYLERLHRRERGVVLIIVLILLAVGSIIIAPMLSHMATGVKAGQTYERKTDEYYAADAGVEDALWQITREDRDLHLPNDEADLDWNYTISDVNGKTVDVKIDYVDEDEDGSDVYRVVSVAGADGSDTSIESYAIYGSPFAFFLDNAITSPGDVTIQPGSNIYGDVQYNGSLDKKGEIFGETSDDPIAWPDTQWMIDFYLDDVDTSTPFPNLEIDVNDTPSIGPMYRIGDLSISNSSNTPLTLTLEGTVYTTGDMIIGTTKKDFTLDLNGHTIFVESPSSGAQDAVSVGGKCTITGTGCIIGVGDVFFAPKIASNPDDFIFVMSIEGILRHQPIGDYYGSIAGDLVHTDPPAWLNFPGYSDGDYTGYKIVVRTWQTS